MKCERCGSRASVFKISTSPVEHEIGYYIKQKYLCSTCRKEISDFINQCKLKEIELDYIISIDHNSFSKYYLGMCWENYKLLHRDYKEGHDIIIGYNQYESKGQIYKGSWNDGGYYRDEKWIDFN